MQHNFVLGHSNSFQITLGDSFNHAHQNNQYKKLTYY